MFRQRGLTLLEAMMAGVLLTIIAVAQVKALTHVRKLQTLSAEREHLVRDAHNLAERIGAGEYEIPAVGKAESLDRESGSFEITVPTDAPEGLLVARIHGHRSTPDGPIDVRLTVLLDPEARP